MSQQQLQQHQQEQEQQQQLSFLMLQKKHCILESTYNRGKRELKILFLLLKEVIDLLSSCVVEWLPIQEGL